VRVTVPGNIGRIRLIPAGSERRWRRLFGQ
jgi:hypothetical protein